MNVGLPHRLWGVHLFPIILCFLIICSLFSSSSYTCTLNYGNKNLFGLRSFRFAITFFSSSFILRQRSFSAENNNKNNFYFSSALCRLLLPSSSFSFFSFPSFSFFSFPLNFLKPPSSALYFFNNAKNDVSLLKTKFSSSASPFASSYFSPVVPSNFDKSKAARCKNVNVISWKVGIQHPFVTRGRKTIAAKTRLNMMFDNFTEKAIKVIMLAQEETRHMGHDFVGIEQLFLGILGQPTGVAGKLLKNLGINLKEARQKIEEFVGKNNYFSADEIPFTPRAKKALERAVEEAKNLGHIYIDTEHLLLGILMEKDTNITKLLTFFGVDPEKLETHLFKILNDSEEFSLVGGTGGGGGGNSNTILSTGSSSNNSGTGRYRTLLTLKEYSVDLTDKAAKGVLDPVVGRSKEINRVVQILGRRRKSNPVLIGEPGVGKSAIAEGLAQRIATRSVPTLLLNKKVCVLDMGLLVAGTKYRGEFEERLKNIIEDIKKARNVILVVDEIHTLIGAGGGEGALDAANLLKPALARGDIQCIGATTLDEYKKHFERDVALERRFQSVLVGEPNADETKKILKGLSEKYEKFHGVQYTNDALNMAVKYAEQYITDRYLPDKAIDLMDEAGSNVKIRFNKHTASCGFHDIKEKLSIQEGPKESEDSSENWNEKQKKRRDLLENLPQNKTTTPYVTSEDVAEVVSIWTGIPITKLTRTDTQKLMSMEEYLHTRVIGQDEAVSSVCRAIKRTKLGFKHLNRPVASFLFSGPTGVGKTQLTKALAHYLFDSESAMIRLDMSEYMERFAVNRLTGSPPGYVGHEEGGQLTEAVRRKPYSVILFDEIEKAHPDVFNTLLQILEDGRLTDAKGRTVDFKNAVIILTSNLGSKIIQKAATGGGKIGFDMPQQNNQQNDVNYHRIKTLVLDELKVYFRPEFLNRLDETLVFRQLARNEVEKIADIFVDDVVERAHHKNLDVVVTERFKKHLIDEGFDPAYGARPLRRAVTRLLEDNIAEASLCGKITSGDKVVVDFCVKTNPGEKTEDAVSHITEKEKGDVIVLPKEEYIRRFKKDEERSKNVKKKSIAVIEPRIARGGGEEEEGGVAKEKKEENKKLARTKKAGDSQPNDRLPVLV